MELKVFYSYAHEDKTLRAGLEKHLAILKRLGLITNWHDRDIKAGREWEREIDSNLNTANIILLLISPDFVNSEYCYSKEMSSALTRHNEGSARVIPIILRPGLYDGLPFSKLEYLPTDGTPIRDRKWHTLDEAFSNAAQGIREVVNELLGKQWIEEADICFYREQYEKALEAYEKVEYFDPRNPLAHIGEGNTRLKLASPPSLVRPCDNYKKALQAFEKALLLDDTIAQAYAGKGRALFGLYSSDRNSHNEINKSVIEEAYNKAIELEPQNDIFYAYYAELHIHFLDAEEALKAYEKVVELATFLDPSVYTAIGDLFFYGIGDYEKSLVNYEKHLQECPTSQYGHIAKGRTLYKLDRYEEALIVYEKAIHLGETSAYLGKGDVLYKLNRYYEAIEAYDEVIKSKDEAFLVDAYKGKASALRILAEETMEIANELEESFLPLTDLLSKKPKAPLPSTNEPPADEYDPFLDEDDLP